MQGSHGDDNALCHTGTLGLDRVTTEVTPHGSQWGQDPFEHLSVARRRSACQAHRAEPLER